MCEFLRANAVSLKLWPQFESFCEAESDTLVCGETKKMPKQEHRILEHINSVIIAGLSDAGKRSPSFPNGMPTISSFPSSLALVRNHSFYKSLAFRYCVSYCIRPCCHFICTVFGHNAESRICRNYRPVRPLLSSCIFPNVLGLSFATLFAYQQMQIHQGIRSFTLVRTFWHDPLGVKVGEYIRDRERAWWLECVCFGHKLQARLIELKLKIDGMGNGDMLGDGVLGQGCRTFWRMCWVTIWLLLWDVLPFAGPWGFCWDIGGRNTFRSVRLAMVVKYVCELRDYVSVSVILWKTLRIITSRG